jgi:hypothetical protein
MRIFSIHKSKSKKQVSEKTPKLAAQKFLEKKKVGTVIYLHEHPSGKIHGPYKKEYDKKIMKGGLSVEDFRVDRPQNSQTLYPPVLKETNQLIIKRPRVGFISNKPRIFFGDNTMKDSDRNYYYKYVCKNLDSNINSLIMFRELQPSINGEPPKIRILNNEEVKQIPKEILLGFYFQYILRCSKDFTSSEEIDFRIMYMRRLFFYLLYNIFPIIYQYINENYISKYQNILQRYYNNELTRVPGFSELKQFMYILKFIQRVDIVSLLTEIKRICNFDDNQYQLLLRQIKSELTDFNNLTPQQEMVYTTRVINQTQRSPVSSAIGNAIISSAHVGVNPIVILEVIGHIILAPVYIIGGIMKLLHG